MQSKQFQILQLKQVINKNNKTKTMKKIHLYAMLLFICSIAACKKEEVNNPDIDDVTINLSAENTDPTDVGYKDISINNEVNPVFQFFIFHPDEDPNKHTIELRIYNSNYEFLIVPSGLFFINKVEKNTELKPTSEIWHINNGQFIKMYYKSGATEYGFSDIGDQYIAFRKKNTTGGYNYGWMLVNIERGEKITIKEYALLKIADTPIKAGEK